MEALAGRLASETLEQSLAAQASAAEDVHVESLAEDLAVVRRLQGQEQPPHAWAAVAVAWALTP